jgi:hypothetical protein
MTKKATTSKSGFIRPSTLVGVPIPDHDGLLVTDCSGTISGLQGGFAKSAKMERIHIPVGSKVVGLWWGEADSHEYDRRKEGTGKDATVLDEFVETTVYKATHSLLIDPDDVEELVTKHNARVAEAEAEEERLRREAKGEFGLPFPETGDGEAPALTSIEGGAGDEPAP